MNKNKIKYGQLGTGDKIIRNYPVLLNYTGLVFNRILTGLDFTIGINDKKKIYSW
jgi:hypothetical protein